MLSIFIYRNSLDYKRKFETLEDAEKEANAIKATLYRFSRASEIPFTALLCISEHSLKNAEAILVKDGSRGKPQKHIVSKCKLWDKPKKLSPHLHILICYERFEEKIIDKLISSINKRCSKEIAEKGDPYGNIAKGFCSKKDRYSVDNPIYYIKYMLRQATIVRYVDDYSNTIPVDFKLLHKRYVQKRDGIYFHKNFKRKLPELPVRRGKSNL